jgi:hypothetical protein
MSTTRKPTVRRNSGADIGSRERINFIEGANITIAAVDDPANKEVDVTITGAAGNIAVNKNGGAPIGTRPELSFIEGANITLTIVDDGPNNEVDITIASGAGVAAHAATHEPAGADEVGDIDILNTGVLLSAHKARHVAAGADAFVGGDLLDATARTGVSRNSAADVGARRTINFIEGANITLTVADDAPGEEVDVTIAAGGGGDGTTSQWFPASDPNNFKGNHPSMLMSDGIETTIRQSFVIPESVITLAEVAVVVIPNGSGNLDWEVATDFGLLCGGEQYNANSDSTTGTTAVTNGEIECINFTAALTGATAKDLVGIEFKRDGDDVTDTVNADVHFIGIWIRGTAAGA